jgi:diguanylate cyclase (GGDEF)-like protein/PAS domain S-box-containing protein
MMPFEGAARADMPANEGAGPARDAAEPARLPVEDRSHRIRVHSTLDVVPDMIGPGVFEHFPDALILADGHARVAYLNPAAERMLDVTLKCAPDRALDTMLRLQDGVTGAAIRILDLPAQRRATFSGAFPLLMSRDGGLLPVQCSVAATATPGNGAGSGYLISLRDVSSIQQHIDKLVVQAMHDEHTRLLRRAELIKRLWRLLQDKGDGESQAFMYLDLDNFKSVNDTAGHAAGDLAIREIASLLKDVVRGRDTLARLGGDEFGLLLERCPAELARQRAMQLHQAVETYVLRWKGETFRLGISIGLAIFKTRKHSLNTILAAADAACYQAKRNGDGAPHIQLVHLD